MKILTETTRTETPLAPGGLRVLSNLSVKMRFCQDKMREMTGNLETFSLWQFCIILKLI